MNHIKPYKDLTGQYRYKIVSRNGKTLADSGEGFKTRAGLKKNIEALAKIFTHCDTVFDALLALKLLK